MAEPVDEFFEELRREYLAEAAVRLAELRMDLAALRAGDPGAAQALKGRVHRLAGSGGSYGFPLVSQVSRETEALIASNPTPDAAVLDSLDQAVVRLADAFDAAAESVGLPKVNPDRFA
ncbi:MAG: Hpt domain-containing protein [Gemmatimonadota bacterium]